MKNILSFLFLLLSTYVFSQNAFTQLSVDAEISILTIGPGEDLTDQFGHTAIRVKDEGRDIDAVFNYGVYDWDTPNFYLKFARGKLLYKLEAYPFEYFFQNYQEQRRWIKSQALNLTVEEKQGLFDFLARNSRPENKFYKYDFFYDNCATRPYEAVVKGLSGALLMDYSDQVEGLSHRDLIHQYIPANSWGSLGIDVALGSVIDRPATSTEYLFLPNELFDAFAKAELKTASTTKKLVKETTTLYDPDFDHSYGKGFFTSPLFVFLVIALLVLYKTYLDFRVKKSLGWLDISLFLVTGIAGILIFFLWLGTDHSATAWNYNLLWAFPFHFLAAFVIAKKNPPRWIYPYTKLALILIVLLFFHWMIGVQQYPITILPLLIAFAARYAYMISKLKQIRDSEEN